MSSCFNFRIRFVYLPFLLHLSVTNACLLSELLSDLLITMLNPDLPVSVWIHWRIWSQRTNFCSFINCLPISTLTSTDLTSIDIIGLGQHHSAPYLRPTITKNIQKPTKFNSELIHKYSSGWRWTKIQKCISGCNVHFLSN